MKITHLKSFVVDEGGQMRVFAKVYTDEGVTGFGEGTIAGRCQAIATAIMEQERLIVGKDPSNIEGLWQAMYRYPRWRGGPIMCSALSAIEIALWDIKGKALGVPIYQLLGGACRDRIRMYVGAKVGPPEVAAEDALASVVKGYTAIKISPFPIKDGIIHSKGLVRTTVAKVKAIREAVGEDIEIMIDCHGMFTPVMAVDLAQRVEEYDVSYLEETTQPEDLDALAWVAERVKVPLATGERLFTKWAFADLVSRHLVSVIQPDVVHCGGISEMKKIATLAEAHFIDVAPHNGTSEVTTMASVHVNACTPNCILQEHTPADEYSLELFEGVVEVKDGYAVLPTKPGLGMDLNEKVAVAHPYVPDYRHTFVWSDGSVADA